MLKVARLSGLCLMALFICFALFPQGKLDAATDENPLLEYSHHIKFDLKWLEDFFQKALISEDPEEKYRTKLKDKFYLIENTGIFALDSITLDCKLEDDRFVGNSKIDVDINPDDESFFQMMVSNPPQLSVVRALIPQDEPLLWISAANPAFTLEVAYSFLSLYENLLSPGEITENSEESICETPTFKFLNELSEFTGNEAHFILYDIKTTDYEPELAVIATLKENIAESEIESIKESFKSFFVDKKEKAEISTWKWKGCDVIDFKEWGFLNGCLLVEKYYLIFSSSQESLKKTAEYVLNPNPAAQTQMPMPMNYMLTVNLTKTMKLTRYIDLEFLFGYSMQDSQKEDWHNKYIKRKRYGTLQLIITNFPDGVFAEFSLDKTLATQIIRLIKAASGFGFKETMKYVAGMNDLRTSWNLDRLNSGIKYYHSEHEKQYPESIDSLMEHYKAKIELSNPFTKEEMRNRAFSDRAEGDFTYLPIKDAKSGLITKYYLIGYGDKTVGYDGIKNDVLINKGLIEIGSDSIVDDVMYVKSSEF